MKPNAKTFPAKVENLDAANAFVEMRYNSFNFDPDKQFKVLLALEEAFVNICHYAYPGNVGDVVIDCGLENDSFVLEISDKGEQFDVLSLPDPDISLDIMDRPVGGLGIHFIRTLSSQASYSRKNDMNVLRMVFDK